MATLHQSNNEADLLKNKLQGLSKNWDGKNCIVEMKDNHNRNWRQMEWIGFYAEYAIRKLLNMMKIWYVLHNYMKITHLKEI
jgi:hypothetical protein